VSSGERGLIARHAGTVLVGQLAVMAFGVTDTIIAGRYSENALAALSVGAAIFISVYVSLMGVLQALLPSGPNCTAVAAAASGPLGAAVALPCGHRHRGRHGGMLSPGAACCG
jgi:hypothetical protein